MRPTRLPFFSFSALAGAMLVACAGAATSDAQSSANGLSAAAATATALACGEGFIADANGTTCDPILLQTCAVPPVASTSDVNLATDVVYSTPYRGQTYAAPQGLDIAWPRTGGTHPLVIAVHGGGWNGGEKEDHRQDIQLLAGQGYVAASINYRLVVDGWQNRFPAQPSDVRCAVRWLKHNAASYGADPTRIVAIGDSAGGELVELLGTEPNESQLDDGQCETSDSAAVTAVIAYYGRADLSIAPLPQYLVDYIGRDGDWQNRQELGSAADHVTAATTPMLLLHGQDDGTVPIAQSRLMRDKLVAAGVPVSLMELPGQGHAFPYFGTDGDLPMASCSTLNFLDHFARNPAPTASTAVRSVVYVEAATEPGQTVLVRGGHDLGLVSAGKYLGGNEPIFYPNVLDPSTALFKPNDTFLSWFNESPLDWTCAPGSASCGPETYLANGYASDPEAVGTNQWKLDVTMEGAVGDWFEVKALVRTNGQDGIEGTLQQAGTPYSTGNHWARKGYITRLKFGQSSATYEKL